jgi:hypothetical protein
MSPDSSSVISDLQLNTPGLNLSQKNDYPELCGFIQSHQEDFGIVLQTTQ